MYCQECGCCSHDGRGWIAQIEFDPDEGRPPRVVAYCPPCAASEFGYRPEAAERYECAWEPLPGQVIDGDESPPRADVS